MSGFGHASRDERRDDGGRFSDDLLGAVRIGPLGHHDEVPRKDPVALAVEEVRAVPAVVRR